MTEYPVLTNAPIIEALLDIQTETFPDSALPLIDSMGQKLLDRFPVRQIRQNVNMEMTGTEHGVQSFKQHATPVGLICANLADGKIVQLRLDGFAFSKLKPYSQWSEFYPEALELFGLYTQSLSPTSIIKLALRYVNVLELPRPLSNFSEYIPKFPQLPDGLPRGMTQFEMAYTLAPTDAQPNFARIQLRLEPSADLDQPTVPVFFDIEVFRFITSAFNSPEISPIITSLRDYKNQIFYSHLTKKGLRPYR
jgi:uncharacterized protein (TIGR04255 family)